MQPATKETCNEIAAKQLAQFSDCPIYTKKYINAFSWLLTYFLFYDIFNRISASKITAVKLVHESNSTTVSICLAHARQRRTATQRLSCVLLPRFVFIVIRVAHSQQCDVCRSYIYVFCLLLLTSVWDTLSSQQQQKSCLGVCT